MKLIFFILFVFIFLGCATRYPASVCLEYQGIRRESKNFVFCRAGIIYDKNERQYLRRFDDDDLDLPGEGISEK